MTALPKSSINYETVLRFHWLRQFLTNSREAALRSDQILARMGQQVEHLGLVLA